MAAVDLHVELRGPDGAPPVVLLHGFTQTGRCWAPVDDDLSVDHRLLLVDAPGHGGSADVQADLWQGADLVSDAIERHAGGGPTTVVGYSMGGRLALHIALAQSAVVERLVLIGATPGLEDDAERAERRASDDALAERIEAIGVSAFLDEWLALPLFAGLPAERAQRAERERNTAAGLASSLRQAGTGTQEPVWDRLGELGMPVLLVTGAHDAKFTRIAERMVALLRGPVEHLVVPGAGHTAHLERPDAFLAALHRWLPAQTGH